MLLDGGYINNLPADVMLSTVFEYSPFSEYRLLLNIASFLKCFVDTMSCNRVIAVDVGSADDRAPMDYGDSLSGYNYSYSFISSHPFFPQLVALVELYYAQAVPCSFDRRYSVQIGVRLVRQATGGGQEYERHSLSAAARRAL